MPKSYQLIQTQTLTSTAASVTFSNIPQNYTDLKLMVSSRDTFAGAHLDVFLQLSGITTSVYTYRRVVGNGSTATSSTGTDVKAPIAIHTGSTATANSFANYEIYIPDYTSASNKSFSSDMVSEQNATLAYTAMYSAIMANTSAVTSIKIFGETAFAIGSTFYLYGVGGTDATGGTITSDSNFTYHTFTSSGVFIPSVKLKNAEALVIAGGGGGGGGKNANETGGGGGGAGGLVLLSVPLLNAGTAYSVVVGSGGAAGTTSTGVGTNGTGSNFIAAAAVGGGGGGSKTVSNNGALGNGSSGGSGGGASGQQNGTSTGGSGTAGQGNAGGNSQFSVAGGGGGAGFAGALAQGNDFYEGGWGLPYHVWGMATGTGDLVQGQYYYAGGGGGGHYASVSGTASGGRGGGGAGGANGTAAGSAATANTGGGGGGGSNASTPRAGGAGGSGLVIIRYPNT
jgi:hypothetical protein